MINLAGDKDCDETIREELQAANIPIVELGASMDREVPSSVIGMLNGFKFIRGWCYWMVYGYMPLKQAQYIYDNYKGLSIRCAGHCGNPNPIEWCEPKGYREKCKPIIDRFLNKEITDQERISMCCEIRKQCEQFIDTYHVDTQEGLNKLAEIIINNKISAN